ncbi:MAG: YncE family protein [Niabella sp.]
MKSVWLVITAVACSANISAQHAAASKVLKTFPIGGDESGWDYLTVNPSNDLLYVSHGKQVEVLDKTTGKIKGVIEGTDGVHGIAFDGTQCKGFISCGKLNVVKVFDANTNQVNASIATGNNPDAIFFEPYSKKIVVCNGKSNNINIIDPISNTVVNTIDVGGKPETAVSNSKGSIFVNIEDKNEIVVIDAKSFNVLHHWSLDKEEGPSGLAIDTRTNRLFSTCDKMLVIADAGTGKIIKKIPIGDGCDGAAFDEQTKTIYTSNGEGTVSVVHENNANSFTKLKDIVTKKGAKTIALDRKTHLLYLSTADLSPAEKDNRGRAKVIPGTFKVLVTHI